MTKIAIEDIQTKSKKIEIQKTLISVVISIIFIYIFFFFTFHDTFLLNYINKIWGSLVSCHFYLCRLQELCFRFDSPRSFPRWNSFTSNDSSSPSTVPHEFDLRNYFEIFFKQLRNVAWFRSTVYSRSIFINITKYHDVISLSF